MGIDTEQQPRRRRDGAARALAALAAALGGAMRSLAFALYPLGRSPRRRLPPSRPDGDAIDWNDPRIH